jgi:HAD superfamily hydrolase (TIGR01509 family)
MIPTHIRAVIFDVDGLLIDSEPYWRQTTKAFFAKYNKPFHENVHRHIMGMGLREIIEYFKHEHGFIGETEALVKERIEMLYELLLKDVVLMEGVEELIRKLHKKGMPLAIATSAHIKEKTQLMLGKFGLEEMFTVFVSGEDVHKAKPAPDIYLKTADLLAVNPKDCLVLEDAPKGVQAGKAAGMYVIGVNKDERIFNELKEAGADSVCHSLEEVI